MRSHLPLRLETEMAARVKSTHFPDKLEFSVAHIYQSHHDTYIYTHTLRKMTHVLSKVSLICIGEIFSPSLQAQKYPRAFLSLCTFIQPPVVSETVHFTIISVSA